MTWKKGQSGNPGGQPNKDSKPWIAALERSLAQYAEGDVKRGQALRKIADKLVQKALDGNMDAVEEIAIRLDGKPAQAITGADGGPLILGWQPPQG